ncbi:MAG: hypothetical protein LBE38_07030 [Deltaproteobacteria bacterium]|nr:hypothetical protein [Deltaproteobacteria bacterium]
MPPQFEDIFSAIFGTFGGFDEGFGNKRSRRSTSSTNRGRTWSTRKGDDIDYTLNLSFKDAALGTKITLNIDIPKTCALCNGTGVIASSGGGVRGCPDCHGHGVVMGTKELSTTIPAGAEDGQKLRLKGNGAPGEGGGPPGDLFLIVKVQPDPDFRRVKNDLYVDRKISLYTAMLGGQVEVRTLSGRSNLKVPAGTQNGAKFRIKGKGIAPAKGKVGDMFVTFKVVLPIKLDDKARELVGELSKEAPVDDSSLQ